MALNAAGLGPLRPTFVPTSLPPPSGRPPPVSVAQIDDAGIFCGWFMCVCVMRENEVGIVEAWGGLLIFMPYIAYRF